MNDYAAPDSYAAALASLRTPAERAFSDAQNAQFAAIEARAASASAEVVATLRVLATNDDLVAPAPCGYCAHINELRRHAAR